MAQQIQLRRGTAAAWTAANPVLAEGELGIETDTAKIKAGDGSTAWVSLGYVVGGGGGSSSGGSGALKCRTASTVSNDLVVAGTFMDAVTLVSGDVVLLKDQAASEENGPYLYNGAGNPLTRYTDFTLYDDISGGLFTVTEGTTNGDRVFLCTSAAGGTIDVTALTFAGIDGVTTYAALSDAITAALPTLNTPLSTALGLKATIASPAHSGTGTGTLAMPVTWTMSTTPAQSDNSTKVATTAYADTLGATKGSLGLIGANGTDVTSSRDLTSADFVGTVLRINAAGSVAITVPTVAAMSLAATSGQLRVIAFEVVAAGIPTFAGKTASTTINGTAGTSTVLPLGGAPVQYGFYVLTQLAVGGNDWSLI